MKYDAPIDITSSFRRMDSCLGGEKDEYAEHFGLPVYNVGPVGFGTCNRRGIPSARAHVAICES